MDLDLAGLTDVTPFLEAARAREFFAPRLEIVISRAPGRLDVMGGIADYSGSLVLQRPIAEATFAAVQPAEDQRFTILSLTAGTERAFTLPVASLSAGGNPISYEQSRELFRGSDCWAGYVAGVFLVLMRERGAAFKGGARVLISSSVPEGKGVASSAALEVAPMHAVAGAFNVALDPQTLAILCQMVENLVVGAPCGLMDQMACACSESGALMAMLCQPAQLEESVKVPQEISFWGLDSGERHTVGGSDYRSVRTGAFMGHRMIGTPGYLASLSPAEFEQKYMSLLPVEMSGRDFLVRYGRTFDTVTTVDPSRTYKVRHPAAHPVYENHRVRAFRELLQGPQSEENWRLLGKLMYESHASYTACGLGSPGTDLIVKLVRAEEAQGLYGARITGGGSGGTVAVVGRADAHAAVRRVVEAFERLTGHRPHVFEGTSPGAVQFGSLRINI